MILQDCDLLRQLARLFGLDFDERAEKDIGRDATHRVTLKEDITPEVNDPLRKMLERHGITDPDAYLNSREPIPIDCGSKRTISRAEVIEIGDKLKRF